MSELSRNSIRQCAEKLAVERLAEVHGNSIFRVSHRDHTRQPAQNLVPGIEKNDFWNDLGDGAGNELTDDERGPAKFCAAFSSSALAVNAFGPFRHSPRNLNLLGLDGFSDTQFERVLPTGLQGTPPHLDFYASSREQIICVESKFLELLWKKEAKFADSYEGAIESLAESSWDGVYCDLKSDAFQYAFLDAAQLVKHYLGMRNTLGSRQESQTLLYLYWEPTNAEELEVYKRHCEEVSHFAVAVAESKIRFVGLSYPQLWAAWKEGSAWRGMRAHISNLQQRYAFSIAI